MSIPYQPVAPHVRERLAIAILCNESMDLYWQDEESLDAYVGRVYPEELVERDGVDYLCARNEEGEPVQIRLDLIRNLPTPMK